MCRQTSKIININAPAFGGAKVGKKVRKLEKSVKSIAAKFEFTFFRVSAGPLREYPTLALRKFMA